MPKENKNIYQRLLDVMKEVKGVNKGSAKVNNQYAFVSHDAVARLLHDPLINNGIMMTSSVVDVQQDGNRTSIMLEVLYTNVDKPEDRIKVLFPGYGIDNQDKGIGKAISYAMKYCLLKTFCLETGDDCEKDNIDHRSDKREVLDPETVKEIDKYLKGHDDIRSGALKICGVSTLDEIKKDQIEAVRKYIGPE